MSRDLQKKLSIQDLINFSNTFSQALIESEGEIGEELELAMAEHNMALSQKADAVAFVLDQMDFRSDFLSSKIKELQDAKKAIESKKDRLESHVIKLLELQDGGFIKGEMYNLKLRKSSGKTFILNEEEIPLDYKFVKHETHIDKKKILEHLREGKNVPGAALSFEPSLMKSITK